MGCFSSKNISCLCHKIGGHSRRHSFNYREFSTRSMQWILKEIRADIIHKSQINPEYLNYQQAKYIMLGNVDVATEVQQNVVMDGSGQVYWINRSYKDHYDDERRLITVFLPFLSINTETLGISHPMEIWKFIDGCQFTRIHDRAKRR